MCGIAGISGRPDTKLVRAMLAELPHRGPDGRGLWRDGRHAFGHTRLSIIDLAGGAQPMARSDGRWRVTYNGEIYNYRELRASMAGADFRTQSDTEVLLELAACGQPVLQWVQQLDGMFAFALAHDEDLMLARDPLGIKPLYLADDRGALVFASELKAFPASAEKIREFPPGHVYTDRMGLWPYYRPGMEQNKIDLRNPESAKQNLRQRLEEAVCKRLVADVPVGVFLSGGLDSSLIAALARLHKDPLETFSVCTADGEDREPARQVAQLLGTTHHEYMYNIEEAIEALPQVIYHLESFDCALVRSAIANFFLARLASKHVKVALAGEGADELFAGYDYLKALSPRAVRKELRQITRALHNTNLQRCDRMSMAHGLEVRVPFLDVAVVDSAFRMPLRLKQHGPQRTEKWIVRKVAEDLLPPAIAWRKKSKFAIGSGLGDHLARYAQRHISDSTFAKERWIGPDVTLRSKEELMYFRMFREFYPRDELIPLVGRSRSL